MSQTVLRISEFIPGSGIITDDHISNTTALDADKLQHLHKAVTNFGFLIGDTPTTKEVIVFVASATATVRRVAAMLNVDGSATGITVVFKKNGATIQTGTIALTHSVGDRVEVVGVIASGALVAGDVLSCLMTVTTATGASGPYAYAEIEELAA